MTAAPARCSYMQLARLRAAYAEEPWLKAPIAFGLHLSRASLPRLPAALSSLMHRHPVLCATFPGPDRVEYHRPPGPGEVPLEVVDASWTHESVLARIRTPFAPGADRLHRYLVAAADHADPGGAVLVVAVDHLLFDGYSVDVFRRDLGALLAGEDDLDRVFGPAAPYREFVDEQERFVTGPKGVAARDHWLRRWERSGLYPALPQPDFSPEQIPALRHVSFAAKGLGHGIARTAPGCAALAALAQAIRDCADRPPNGTVAVTAITPYLNRSRRFMNSLGYFDNRVQAALVAEAEPELTRRNATDEWMNILRYGSYPFELIVRELFVSEYSRQAQSPYLFFTSSPRARSSAPTTPELAQFTDVESFKDYNSLTVSHGRGDDGADLFDLIFNTSTVSEAFVQRLVEGMTP